MWPRKYLGAHADVVGGKLIVDCRFLKSCSHRVAIPGA